MKKLILTLTGVLCAVSLFAQGQVQLNNRVTGSCVAPVFGPQIGDPFLEIHGNTATGVPAGTTTYNQEFTIWNRTGGATPTYMAQFFGGPLGTDDASLAPLTPTAGFRTYSAGAGFVQAPADTVVVPGVPSGSSARLQLRAWDTRGGTITTWADAVAAAASGNLLIGDSLSFNAALGGGPISPPAPIGLTSFNLHFVPEPSVIALGVLGVGALVLFRRRKN